jgi:hypothetical protein
LRKFQIFSQKITKNLQKIPETQKVSLIS